MDHADLVHLLNAGVDAEAWYHEGTLRGAPGTALHGQTGGSTDNAPDATMEMNEAEQASLNSSSSSGMASRIHAALSGAADSGPIPVPEEARAAVELMVRTAILEARRLISNNRFTAAWRCIEPHIYLMDGSSRSCHYILDVLAGRAELVSLEVVRPPSQALSLYVSYLYPDTSKFQHGTQGNQGNDGPRNRPGHMLHGWSKMFRFSRSYPWVRWLPVRGSRVGNAKHHARGIFETPRAWICFSVSVCRHAFELDRVCLWYQHAGFIVRFTLNRSFTHLTSYIYKGINGLIAECKHAQEQAALAQDCETSQDSPPGPLLHQTTEVSGPMSGGNMDHNYLGRALRILCFWQCFVMNNAVHFLEPRVGYQHTGYADTLSHKHCDTTRIRDEAM